MAAFVAVHPQWLSAEQAIINLGERQVEITQLIPIYKSEQHWLADQGDLQTLLAAYPKEELMNPRRKPFVSDGESTVDKLVIASPSFLLCSSIDSSRREVRDHPFDAYLSLFFQAFECQQDAPGIGG